MEVEGKTLLKLLGMNDDLLDRVRGIGSEIWKRWLNSFSWYKFYKENHSYEIVVI